MKLAFFSPLNPQPSGISDYTEELLPFLAESAEIDLFVDGFKPSNKEIAARFSRFDYRANPDCLRRLDQYDAVIYHMGNDHRYHAGIYDVARQHPGIMVCHDFALQDFFLGLARRRGDMNIYLDEMEACHGESVRAEAAEALARGGAPPQVALPAHFPMNRRLALGAEAIIVHSQWSRARFAEIAPGVPVARINMPIRIPAAQPPRQPQPDGKVTIANFGLITPGKGITSALRALATLKRDHSFHYTLVGETNSFFDVRALVRAYGMTEHVTITGYVSLEEFERRISATDIALNMRERTVGETSASLCRIMAAGVPAIVSNVGWYGELPDDCVIKIDADEYTEAMLEAYLRQLMEDQQLRARIGENARRHMLAEHAIEQRAADHLAFIKQTIAARARRRLLDAVSGEMSLLGIRPADEELLRGVAEQVAAIAPAQVFASQAAAAVTPLPPSTGAPPASAASQPLAEPSGNGRLRKIENIDYKRAAIEYPRKLNAERYHHLFTKPFYNLAHKLPKFIGDGMDADTFRHFCDFANIAVALALPAGSRLLDVGCGSGWLSEYFARLGYDVTGIDISPDLIEISRERVARVPYGVDHETPLRCRFITHDIESAPLAETFAAVICYDSLHHFEDERAVIRHLAQMVEYGGLLFILEGDKPEEGSAGAEELLDVVRRFQTLEAPFDREYLRRLLVENGFALIGDFISVNGLFDRDALQDGKLAVNPPELNYLLCKKVVAEGVGPFAAVPDSSRPGKLAAHLSLAAAWPERVAPGEMNTATLRVENIGDTLWLTGSAERAGSVMLGLKLFDEAGELVREQHGEPPLPRALAPGERAELPLRWQAPYARGLYTLKLDLVAQSVCWFEQHGSAPLALRFHVR